MNKARKASKFLNTKSYLQQFWPKEHKSTPVWEENKWLLEQYVLCAQIIDKSAGRKLKAIEISSGPTLAPLIPFTRIIDEIQLSDYDPDNRKIISKLDINYWENYTKEVYRIEKEQFNTTKVRERLQKLDQLRLKNKVAYVDIKKESQQIFEPAVEYKNYSFYIMHFVVDSIVDTKNAYFELLQNVIKKILKKDDLFLMSALVECTIWDDGIMKYPSANISTSEIIKELELLGFKIIFSNEKIHKAGVGHDGGFAVILSQYI